ncbi:hypothetical protein K1719_039170 [Acacia pycnantha]|nr:hypothetical protein K1719_039170 [Acacia pycnantha]
MGSRVRSEEGWGVEYVLRKDGEQIPCFAFSSLISVVGLRLCPFVLIGLRQTIYACCRRSHRKTNLCCGQRLFARDVFPSCGADHRETSDVDAVGGSLVEYMLKETEKLHAKVHKSKKYKAVSR